MQILNAKKAVKNWFIVKRTMKNNSEITKKIKWFKINVKEIVIT